MYIRTIVFISIVMVLIGCSPDRTGTVNEEDSQMHDFDKLWNYNEPGETEQKFRAVLTNSNDQENAEYVLELKTQISRTLGLQQKFEEAHKLLDQVEAEMKPEYPIAKIRYMLERGRAFNSSGKKEESLPLFLEAWELGVEVKADFYAVDADRKSVV